jgi:hypothetical protein
MFFLLFDAVHLFSWNSIVESNKKAAAGHILISRGLTSDLFGLELGEHQG